MSMRPAQVKFSFWEPFEAALPKIKGSKLTFFIPMVILIIISVMTEFFGPTNPHIWKHYHHITVGLIFILITTLKVITAYILIYLGLRRALDMPIKLSNIKDLIGFQIILRLIGLMIICSLISLISILTFFILPSLLITLVSVVDPEVTQIAGNLFKLVRALFNLVGIVFTLHLVMRMLFASSLVLMKKMKPWPAVKLSFKVTKSYTFKLFSIFLVNLLLFVVAGIITLGIGLIWVGPWVCIIRGELYKKFLVENNSELVAA